MSSSFLYFNEMFREYSGLISDLILRYLLILQGSVITCNFLLLKANLVNPTYVTVVSVYETTSFPISESFFAMVD